jgi:hypothetical protein
MKISFKSIYIYFEIIIAFIFIAILLFVVPENFSFNNKIYIHIDVPGNSTAIADALIEGENKDSIVFVDSFNEIKPNLEKDRNSVGLNISHSDNKIVYEFILQGYENQKFRNILQKSFTSSIASKLPGYKKVTNTITIAGGKEKLSDRLNMLPVFLVFNSSLMGLFIIAAYIFMDKDEGTIKAFVVTPARVWEYLLSKVGVMLVMGLITGLITTVFIAGTKVHYLHLILLLVVTNAFGSCLGLYIASFYDSFMKSIGVMYIVVIVLTFSTISYYMPAFSPIIIKLLPSYPMLFAFRETLLAEPKLAYIYGNIVLFCILALIFFLLANRRFKKTLTI